MEIEFDITKYTYLARLQSTNKLVVTGKNGLPSWAAAVETCKTAPLKIGVGQFGRGNHDPGILMAEALGLNVKFINSRSTAGNMSMLLRGDVQGGIASEDSVSSLLQAKEVRVLLASKDTTGYPGAVSLKELGHPELGEYVSSHRFAVAPSGFPQRDYCPPHRSDEKDRRGQGIPGMGQ